MNILANFREIKAFVLDVDGVLTDGMLMLLDDGQMCRRMNIKDGYAIQLAVKKGYHVLVISGGSSDAVKLRLQKLGVSAIHMQVTDKQQLLKRYVASNGLAWNEVLYMGDDIPDLASMKLAGLPCCPADAVAEIRELSAYISPVNGGLGCVRDVIEKVLKLNGHWEHDSEVASR